MAGAVIFRPTKSKPKFAISPSMVKKAKAISLNEPTWGFFFHGCINAEHFDGQFPLRSRGRRCANALKKAGLIIGLPSEQKGKNATEWLAFTNLGVEAALLYGFDLTWIDPSMLGNYKPGDMTGFGKVKSCQWAKGSRKYRRGAGTTPAKKGGAK